LHGATVWTGLLRRTLKTKEKKKEDMAAKEEWYCAHFAFAKR
jgi:hypothetical protein